MTNFSAISAFNGYPEPTTDHPFIIRLSYDPTKLKGHLPSSLKIAYFNPTTSRWQALTTPIVIDYINHTLSTTTKNFGLYAVVYRNYITSPILEETETTPQAQPEQVIPPTPPQTEPISPVKPKFCFLFWCW